MHNPKTRCGKLICLAKHKTKGKDETSAEHIHIHPHTYTFTCKCVRGFLQVLWSSKNCIGSNEPMNWCGREGTKQWRTSAVCVKLEKFRYSYFQSQQTQRAKCWVGLVAATTNVVILYEWLIKQLAYGGKDIVVTCHQYIGKPINERSVERNDRREYDEKWTCLPMCEWLIFCHWRHTRTYTHAYGDCNDCCKITAQSHLHKPKHQNWKHLH